ncbi:MAG: hypothetical protein LBH25_00560 [Fibromonadaceae bacterium]|jgi:ABC-type transport system involved in cytochrome c biogenesis ATPase subunit|nr:hypothetical protein [Fibromonadaceae bacterium]
MSNSVKEEFLKWIKTLDINSLSETDNKLINIIVNHFDALAPLGTSGGLRGKKLAELILQYKETAHTVLPNLNTENNTAIEKIERIVEFNVGPFRGFSSNEILNFDNKYIFLYGPNGSGKSSFCEGLEHAILGNIREADTKHVAIEQYIQNGITKKVKLPIAYYKAKDGTKKEIKKNQGIYQFAFVERNRIDGFARIAAVTPSEQKNRIAILFGLDAFSSFVDGFTDNFQYLSTATPIKDSFSQKTQNHEQKKLRLKEIENELSENSTLLKTLIKDVNNEAIIDKNTLRLFLVGNDNNSGIISQLQTQKGTAIPKDIDTNMIKNYISSVEALRKSILILKDDLSRLASLSSDVKFKALFEAITVIENDEKTDKTICPACKTSLSNTTLNPFKNAQSELEKLKELSKLQESISFKMQDISKQISTIKRSLEHIKEIATSLKFEIDFTCITVIGYINTETISTWLNSLSNEIESIIGELPKYNELIQLCENFNTNLSFQRANQFNIDNEIKKYNDYNIKFVQITTIEDKLNIEQQNTTNAIKQFEEANEETLKQIINEQKIIDTHQKYIVAYNKLIISLKNYRNSLPALFSTGLADKAKGYYNVINSHDPNFDKIENLYLPANVGDKIIVQFIGSTEKFDALYILSEGHIKILGLSILLAKIVSEDLKFIILDDIVNAIDDEHKDGIANLLLNHTDMTNRQLILTCHGEMFINKLEHKLGISRAGNEVIRYKFCPMDSNITRSIKISIGNSKHYLLQAIEALKKDDYKDAAFKCRQSVENTSHFLWKKLGKQLNINLSVKMRTPTSIPELSSVVDALIKEIEKHDKKSSLLILLKELKEKYLWNLLNKGAHEQEDLPEFEKDDISAIIEIIKNIEELVSSLKLITTIEETATTVE